MKNIILYGFKSSGKTSVGKILAEKLAMSFIDIDRVIEKLHFEKKHENLTVREMYKTFGESYFRDLEKEVIFSLVDTENHVVATGGGSVLDKKNVAVLKEIGIFIYLEADKNTIKNRLLLEPPAFLDTENFAPKFEEMFEQRKNIYENIADIVIVTDGKDIDAVAQEIIEKFYGK